MTCAYDEEYMWLAQRVLGDMLDYAVNTLGYALSFFYQMFLVSGVAQQFEIGNPRYAAGKNGCEVAREVLERCGIACEQPDLMYLDKSPEYWTGWALAYYQWYSGKSFRTIEQRASVDYVCSLYDPLHEADISKFVLVMEERCGGDEKAASLRRLRAYANLSQRMLAEEADVPIRQIQLFEQGERDIRKTQGETLRRMARVLKCRVEELME